MKETNPTPIIISNDILFGPVSNEKIIWNFLLENIPNTIGIDCCNVLNIHGNFHLMPRDFSSRFRQYIDQNYPDAKIIIQNATYMDILDPERHTIVFLQDNLRAMGMGSGQQENNLRQAKTIVTNSHFTASHYPEYNMEVIPIGVNNTLFQPMNKTELKNQFNFPNKTTGIFVGSYTSVKGWEHIEPLIDKYQDIFWIIVSKDFYEYPNKKHNAVYYSRIQQTLLAQLLNCADFFILASPVETECLAALEAGLCNIPIAMTKTGIFSDINTDKIGIFGPNIEQNMLQVINNITYFNPREEILKLDLTIEETIKKWCKIINRIEA